MHIEDRLPNFKIKFYYFLLKSVLNNSTIYSSCFLYICLIDETIIQLLNLDKVKQLTYRILLNKEPEGGYTVTVPTLPGCITYGETIEEGIDMAKEAIELYIESLKAHGEPIPDESSTLEYSLTIPA